VPKDKETLALNTFDLFHQLANNKEAASKLNRFKTIAPVEVFMIAVFISRFMVCLPLPGLPPDGFDLPTSYRTRCR